MKTLYIHIFTIVLFIGTSISSFGQITESQYNHQLSAEFQMLYNQSIYSGINPPCNCEEVPNITFSYNQFSALQNSIRIQQAYNLQLDAWFNTQRNILKDEIEDVTGTDYPNFHEAQKGLYQNIEKGVVQREIGSVQNSYNTKVSEKKDIRNRCLRNLQLLELRANEINLGNTNNSEYGHLKIGITPLSSITSISQINTLKNSEKNEFIDNQWRLDQEINIVKTLTEVNPSRVGFNINNGLMNELYNKQLSYYNSFIWNEWTQLDLMQLYVNINTSQLYLPSPILPNVQMQYYGRSDYLEWYGIRQNPADLSIFHPDFWKRLIRYPTGPSVAQLQLEILRQEALTEALNSMPTEDFLVDASIEGLGSANENFIKVKPDLHNEVSKYFKVNDFSKASSDCINYLLNQYHNGDDFAANPNLYKSANTPLYQNSQNPNRALEWKPGTQAINEGFTNFGNVLSALFENYPKPAYEGYIIRNMFGVNGLSVNTSIQNEWLGSGFYFKKNNGLSVVVEFENNNGTSILNYGISTNTYLTNLITGLDGSLNLVNEIKRYLFVNPAIAGEYEKFLDNNGSSTNSKILLDELSKVIYEDCYGSPIPAYGTAGVRLYFYYKTEQTRLKEAHPDWSDSKIRNTILLEMFQTGLDVIGLIPGVGEIADLANGVIYLVNGDNVNAGLSFAATIPFVGWGATGSKLAVKITRVSNITSKVALPFIFKAGGIIDFGGKGLLRTVLNITDKAFEAHHIIPWTRFKENPIVQAAANAGFHMNQALNGIPLKKFRKSAAEGLKGLHGNHPKYDDFVEFRIKNYIDANGSLKPEDAKKFLETKLIPELEGWIKKAEGYNGSLNDYFKFVVNPMFF